MNNITGGAGGGGLSGTVDSGRLSQVSGCHGGASNPAAMEKQVFAVFVFFFYNRRNQVWKLIWKRPRCFAFKRSRHRRKKRKTNTLLPRKFRSWSGEWFSPLITMFLPVRASPPACFDSQGTSTQVEVKPTSQRDSAKTLFPVKTPPGPVFISSVPSGWLINRLMALNRCFPTMCRKQ